MAYELGDPSYFGPGTALVERWPQGFGGYVQTQNFMMSPAGQAGIRGLGCGCNGGCSCDGMGLFDNGFDPSTFGPAEWGTVAVIGYALYSMLFTTKRAASSARRKATAVRKGVRRGLRA